MFDTHSHFDTFAAEGRVGEILSRAHQAGVSRMCAVGGSVAANELAVKLVREYPSVLVAAVGLDRDQAQGATDLSRLELLATSPGVVAVGEVGLDYFYSPQSAPAQRKLLGEMLALAGRLRRPVIVHSREADADTLAMLGEFSMSWKKVFNGVEKIPPPGILHCYTGNLDFAEKLMDLGFLISFSGIVSFLNADPLREVARHIPAECLLVETDCPYLTPRPFRGKVNEPAFVARVLEVLAEVRGESLATLVKVTTENALRVFQMEDEHGRF